MVRFRLHLVAAERETFRIKQIAEKAGLERNTVAGIFHNRAKMVALETIDRLCKALGCAAGDLLEYVPD